MTDPRKLRLNLESTLDSVEAAELIVQRMADLNGFADEQVYQIGMGVREMVINAIEHGNGFGSDKTVSFDASVDDDAMHVTVVDQGSGFDPSSVRDPLAEENLMRCSGRGLLLMRAFFDEVSKLVLNLAEVSYIDSSGLGELVSAYTTARSKGCTVKLLHVQAKVQDLLTVTKLYTVFESHTDEAAAVSSF